MIRRTARHLSRARAMSCVLANQLATPGLGSLIAGRWLAGFGQLVLSVAGFVMITVWFFEIMFQYYGQISGSVQPHPVGWIGEWGAILFAVSWLWSLVTSISLLREASRNSLKSFESLETEHISPPVLDLSGKPPEQPPKLS